MQSLVPNPLATSFLHKYGHKLKIGNLLFLPLLAMLLTGMSATGTASASAIHADLAIGTSGRDFIRKVGQLAPHLPQVQEQILACVQKDRRLAMRPSGFLVLDEHIIPHASKGIEGVDSFYSPSEKKVKLGHSLIAVHYWGGKVEYPIAGVFYRRERELKARNLEKEFRKKNAIAREMFKKLASNPNAPITWLLDAFFMTKENGKLIQKLKKYYVSRPKKNWTCKQDRQKTSIADLFDTILPSEFAATAVRNPKTHKVKTYFTATRDVQVKKLGLQRLVFVDGNRLPPDKGAEHENAEVQESPGKKKFRVFITNHLDWDATRILSAYALRWTIETCFRDLSQHLGLHACQWRDIACQQGFASLSMLCYLFLAWSKISGEGPQNDNKRWTIGQLQGWFKRYCKRRDAEWWNKIQEKIKENAGWAYIYAHLQGGTGVST